ncbi:MAG TPA: PKD domain-containing protein, partial [Bacteroidia bacterium]|nr:PKD domain-containing protein [Bacteroidia bacterium]
MKKRLLLFLAFLSLTISGWSTHIVGGTLTYVYNGGSSYTFTLKLFRDCSSGTAAFPNTVTIAVRGYNGATFAPTKDFTMNLGTVTGIPSNLDSCAAPPNPMPCVEQGIYTTTVNNLPANPGGYHCYYQVCCRNLSTSNVNASCNCIGASVSTDIEGSSMIWLEDFTLANGTTVDAGTTAWTRSLGTTPPNYASVQNNLFEFSGANNGQATWLSQQINISSFATGVNLSAVLSRAGNLDLNDSVRTYYSINSGPFVQFTVNGALNNAFTSPSTATAGPLVGNTVQIMVRAHFDGSSPTSELIRLDNVQVAGNNFLSNSSPTFTNFPPLFLCQGNFFSFDHSATDPDGDSLAYSFYTPFTDAAPTYTNNVINFTPVTFLAGFTTTQPIGAGGLALNSSTGILTGTPPTLGQFCVGICVKEYRNGNLLSTTYRDFQFNVVFCPPPAQALITPSGVVDACNGVNVTFPDNSSASANNWFWNFGDGATLADTSHAQYPTYTYSAVGTYTATLITNKGTPCADTSTAVVHVGYATANFSDNAPQCAGTAVSFTNLSSCSSNTTISGYQWNFGDAGTSTATNPTHTYATGGTYTVTLITSTVLGCTDTLQLPVTINPTPATPAPSSNSPICAGSALNLTTSAVAGATYSWTGPNSFSSALQNPTIGAATVAASGTYSLTVTVAGCTSAAGTTVVTVNPIPAPPTAASNSPICAGSTLNLTASNVAGATYSWTGPNSFSSSTQNPSIAAATIAASGTYSVTVTVSGCSSAAATTAVTVSPIPATPTASSNSPICAGSTLNLTASNIAGATYTWSGPNSFSSATQNPTIPGATTAASGTYSVTATVGGCTGSAGTTVVTVSPAPVAPTASSNSPICAGSTLNLTA